VADKANYTIKILDRTHERKNFSCGIEPLDRYLKNQASQDERRHLAATYVLTEIDSDVVIGYYTLSSSSIELSELPEDIIKKLPKYPVLPATLIGRMAIDKKHHGKKLGELLLIDALQHILAVSKKIASIAVIVEAKNTDVVNFYRRYGFIQFSDDKNRLFLPMSVIQKIWN
jgi:predicted GNAT family N-acyltransferase